MQLSRRSRTRGWSSESGGAVVEFALIGMLFLFLVGIVVQGALIFSAWLIITNAVREAARAGAPCYGREVQQCSADVIEEEVREAAGALDESESILDVDVQASGGLLVVRARYPVPLVAPFVELVMPNPMWLNAESSMRLEHNGS